MLKHRVVILGGGFGGLLATQNLRRTPVEVTLIDRRNFHLFQPLLYQVATGGLSPANIAAPLRGVLKRQRNARVLLAEARDFAPAQRRVLLLDGEIEYDTLIVATGASHNYFGNDHWEPFAPGLKTIEDATEIRRRLLLAFEHAEREPCESRRRAWLTFVIVGAGPTGLELAGTLAEIARDTLRRDFRRINPAESRVLLLDAADRVLPSYPAALSQKAAEQAERLGVRVCVCTMVADITADAVTTRSGESTQRIETRTVLWAAGVQASDLGQRLAEATGCMLDRAGRVIVQPDLSIAGHPEIFVIGDLALFTHQAGKPPPGIAPVAMQQGKYAARLITARLEGRSVPPFRYVDKGNMATIGRAAAVADIRGLRLSGYFAWLAWLFVHLFFLIEFQNRVLVMVQWAWNYFTFNRAARLITGEHERRPRV